MGYRNYGPANGFIVSKDGNGDFTTIASALTAATTGTTIFIKPGTYTENLTLKSGVNLSGFGSDSSQNGTGNVIISGTCSFSSSGTVSISGIQLQTNAAGILTLSGSSATIINLENCYLNCTNSSGITFSSSSSSATINIRNCSGDLGTAAIKLFAHTSAGTLNFYDSAFTNSGGSTTSSTITAGRLNAQNTSFLSPITSSGTAADNLFNCVIDSSAQNTTPVTEGGSGNSNYLFCKIFAGTASAVSITNITGIYSSNISSTNTNAITGGGTIQYNALSFSNTSRTINTTTQTLSGTIYGSTTTTPTAGFLGEQFTNSATGVSLTNSIGSTVAQITLTPGVWDVSCIGFCSCSVSSGTVFILSLSPTNNTTTGAQGDTQFQYNVGTAVTFSTFSGVVPVVRKTITTSTTFFAVMAIFFSSGTCTGNARITATRVG